MNIECELKLIKPEPGEVLLCHVDRPIDETNQHQLRQLFGDWIREHQGIEVIIMPQGFHLEQLTDEQLSEAGLQHIPKVLA